MHVGAGADGVTLVVTPGTAAVVAGSTQTVTFHADTNSAGTYHVDPSIDGLRVYSADATPLASGQVQAIRASHRDAAALADPCTSGAVDDHDDLAFDVAP